MSEEVSSVSDDVSSFSTDDWQPLHVDDDLNNCRPRVGVRGVQRWLVVSVGVSFLIGVFVVVFVVYKCNYSAAPNEEYGLPTPKPEPMLKTRKEAVGCFASGNRVCLTKGCLRAATRVIDRMNESANPCDDFYEFSCGNFIQNTVIPDNALGVTTLSEIEYALNRKLRLAVEEKINLADSGATKLAKHLYNSCMDTGIKKNREERGLEPLHEIIKEFGGWPVVEGDKWNSENFSWIDTNFVIRRLGYSSNSLFDLKVERNWKNSRMFMLRIDQPGFRTPRNHLQLVAYFKCTVYAAELFGANRSRAEEEMIDMIIFQIEITKPSLPQKKRLDMTIEEAMNILPGIPLLEYINKMLPEPLQVDASEVIDIADHEYLSNLTSLLARTPNRTIANYLVWTVVAQSAEYLTEELRSINFEYLKVLISGLTTRPPRWEECIFLVEARLMLAIKNLYIKKFFKEESKAQMEVLVTYLRDEFKNILNRLDWMDEITKQETLKKAEAMVFRIAYPKELLNDSLVDDYYSKLIIEDRNLLGNVRNFNIFEADNNFHQLRKLVVKQDWKEYSVIQANAMYLYAVNSLVIPAAILQGDFFQPDRPNYMNFGGIGSVIGHEITHSFGHHGKELIGIDGNWDNWWQPSAKEMFSEKVQCLIEQYGNFTVPEIGMNVNGVITQVENSADNGGIKGSYHAYQKWVRDHGPEDALPGLNYTSNQLFWISSGQTYCSKYKSEYLKNTILTDAHPPGKHRLIGSFSNSREFSKDWNCPVGSNMNPKHKCVIW